MGGETSGEGEVIHCREEMSWEETFVREESFLLARGDIIYISSMHIILQYTSAAPYFHKRKTQ